MGQAKGKSTTAQVKGAALLYCMSWYAKRYGPEQLAAIARRIPPAERDALDPSLPLLGVLATQWYPARTIGLLLDGVTQGLTEAERMRLIRESTTEAVERAIRGVFRLPFKLLGTPERYAKHIQRFWNQIHDTGTRHIEIVGPGEAISIIEDWPGHHPLLCAVTMETMAAVFRRMGLSDVEVLRVECVASHDAHCKAIVRWQPPAA